MRYLVMALVMTIAISALAACGGNGSGPEEADGNGSTLSEPSEPSERRESSESGESGEHGGEGESGEHPGESGEHGEGSEYREEGEESGTQYARDDTYDSVRAGARLRLSYDPGSNAFTGTVENVTDGTLSRVRVEVHLSNGIELGPTPPVDLAPGAVADIILQASAMPFETWSAHPEVG